MLVAHKSILRRTGRLREKASGTNLPRCEETADILISFLKMGIYDENYSKSQEIEIWNKFL
jgi:hypothetical protein